MAFMQVRAVRSAQMNITDLSREAKIPYPSALGLAR